jgi:hypothetical protein
MNASMDRIEQRVMVKYFFLKEQGSKLIHKELVSPIQDNAISLSTVKNWLRRFKSGDLSCGDEERPGRRLICLNPVLHCFLKKVSFVSARVMAGHFSVDRAAIKSILDRELSLRKFTRRWVSHILSATGGDITVEMRLELEEWRESQGGWQRLAVSSAHRRKAISDWRDIID